MPTRVPTSKPESTSAEVVRGRGPIARSACAPRLVSRGAVACSAADPASQSRREQAPFKHLPDRVRIRDAAHEVADHAARELPR